MKRKILWIGLSLLVVAALVLTSCAKEEVVTPGEEEEEEVVVPGEPIYGGTLTLFTMTGPDAPKSWDVRAGYWQQMGWNIPFQSQLAVGDIEKYGPRGSNSFPFTVHAEVPEQFMKGDIVESFEITLDTFTLHLRDDAMWAGNDYIGMAPRKVTADDIVNSLEACFETAIGKTYFPMVTAVTATNANTIVLDWTYFSGWPLWFGGAASGIYSPETLEAGVDDWRNQVSSGPFILTNYVEGSACTYVKNPYYTRETTTINGKEYQVPFIDTLILPIIPDVSTAISALRTGKVDGYERCASTYTESLAATNPELNSWTYLLGANQYVNFHCDTGKWTDKNLRRAMEIGTDRDALGKAVYGDYEIHVDFLYGSDMYTPLDELPASTALLFEYNPTLARQMIADAGYPDGFDMEMYIGSGSGTEQQDLASMLVDQWSKIGVNCTLVTLEQTAGIEIRMTREYTDAYMDGEGNASSEIVDRVGNNTANSTSYVDAWYDEQYAIASAILNGAERNKIYKAMIVHYIDEASRLQLPCGYMYCYMWPWVQNYYGETEAGYRNMIPAISRMWIDQDMKTEMGFK